MAVELRGMKTSSEHPGSSFSGYPVLALIALLLVLAAWNIAGNMPLHDADRAAKLTFVGLLILPILVLAFLAAGFFMIQPNQAAVITLFGAYRGT
jgi:regulator of protease activity HflC (stomatin/prohibitin superfamily)